MQVKWSAIINSISVESKNTAAARSCGNYRGQMVKLPYGFSKVMVLR